MASSLAFHLGATATTASVAHFHKTTFAKPRKFSTTIRCVAWDPEGILGPPQGGHISRLEFKKHFEKDSEAREAFQRQLREEKERRRAFRESRVVPDTAAGLVEYFLDTEAQELEYEIARLRPRLNEELFSHIQFELGKLRFAVSKTQDMEDRVIELEALQKALQEGTEACDKLQGDLVTAKKCLTKILTSEDIKKTLLDMVETNELNRSLLTLLDENIASAHMADQREAAEFMGRLRAAVLKYITV